MISFQENQNLVMNDPQSLLDPNLFLECYQIFEKQVKIDKVPNSVFKRLLEAFQFTVSLILENNLVLLPNKINLLQYT